MDRATKPERVLVLCRPFLGDTVLMGPVFRNLRAAWPDARITAGAYAAHQEALAFFPEIDEVITIPRRAKLSTLALLGEWRRVIVRLRAARFDLVYDLMQTDRSAFVSRISGAPRRASFIKEQRLSRHRFYTDLCVWTEELERTHTLDLYLRGLGELGVPIHTRSTQLALEPEEEALAAERLERLLPPGAGPIVLVHPGASAPNKLWPVERFVAICDELQERFRARLLLLGGPREAEMLEAIRSAMRAPATLLEGRVSLRELAALLRAADLFLCLDSGPMHLAAAVGTPVVAIFGASSTVQWAPLGEGHCVVAPDMPCEACVCPDRCLPPNPYKMFCVRRVSEASVREALGVQIARWAGGRTGAEAEARA